MANDKTVVTFGRSWEMVTAYCKRMKVPGGWMVMAWNSEGQPAICFFADANYTWVLQDA